MRDSLARAPRLVEAPKEPPGGGPEALVELLFFAYRDFVGEPDRVLERYGFGRAHHRVLHFVNRNPGLTIAGLLDILGITKQSLSRVLRDLVDGGFIEQRSGERDRRQRLLRLTPSGQALANELLALQTERVGRALGAAQPEVRAAIRRFLIDLVDPGARAGVAALVEKLPGSEG
jgi:DNA-binding MarR family transcriptional regulator